MKLKKKSSKGRKKRKLSPKKIFKALVIMFLSFVLLCFMGGVAFIAYIVTTTDTFNPENLYTTEASRIYFADGSLIGTVGSEMREKVSYEEISEVLVDAIIATEDSRFFQHNGFNGARFLVATMGQLMGNPNAGGASTITMQVSKNNFTSTEARGIEGIIRKFRDIYISVFQIEKNYTKEDIFEFYVNYPFLGSSSYGVEQASRTYFGKSVSDLSLPEAALIAGLFQAPGAYDPYINPEAAEERRATVLSLMVRHGYITQEEADAANAISVESLLVKDGSSNVSEYQVLLDTVITEVRDDLGMDPYAVSMDIYTTFDKKKQNAINDFYKTYKFADSKVQVGIAVVDNKNGAILAVGGGRNKTREFSYNYATQINRHIGSTAKPIFDYGPAIEYLKWSTYTPLFDERVTYSSGQVMNNWDYNYEGLMTAKYALQVSRNTTALQTFQAVPNKKIKNFVLSLGMTPEIDASGVLHEAHAVGAFEGTNPVQLASAYSAFANGGYYTKGYSYTKIVFRDSGKEIEKDVERTKVMQDYTGYMITDMLLGATPGHNVTGTQIATKTGTSSYEQEALEAAGVTTSAIQDSWVATYSPDYTITFWYGYDKLMKKYYMTMNEGTIERQKIQKILLNSIMKKNSKFKRPSSVVSSAVELETFPAMLPSAYTPSNLKETHLFVKGTQPTETSPRFVQLTAPSNLNAQVVGNTITASWDSPGTPWAVDKESLQEYFNENYKSWATKYYKRRLNYNTKNIGTFGFDVYLKNINGDLEYIGHTTDSSYTFTAPSTVGYTDVVVKSAYSKFKKNASNSISAPASISATCAYALQFNTGEASEITWSLSTSGAYEESSLPVHVSCNSVDVTLDAVITKETGTTIYSPYESIRFETTGTYTIIYKSNVDGISSSITRTIIITD